MNTAQAALDISLFTEETQMDRLCQLLQQCRTDSLPADRYEVLISSEALGSIAFESFRSAFGEINLRLVEPFSSPNWYSNAAPRGRILIFLARGCLPSFGFFESHLRAHIVPRQLVITSAGAPPQSSHTLWSAALASDPALLAGYHLAAHDMPRAFISPCISLPAEAVGPLGIPLDDRFCALKLAEWTVRAINAGYEELQQHAPSITTISYPPIEALSDLARARAPELLLLALKHPPMLRRFFDETVIGLDPVASVLASWEQLLEKRAGIDLLVDTLHRTEQTTSALPTTEPLIRTIEAAKTVLLVTAIEAYCRTLQASPELHFQFQAMLSLLQPRTTPLSERRSQIVVILPVCESSDNEGELLMKTIQAQSYAQVKLVLLEAGAPPVFLQRVVKNAQKLEVQDILEVRMEQQNFSLLERFLREIENWGGNDIIVPLNGWGYFADLDLFPMLNEAYVRHGADVVWTNFRECGRSSQLIGPHYAPRIVAAPSTIGRFVSFKKSLLDSAASRRMDTPAWFSALTEPISLRCVNPLFLPICSFHFENVSRLEAVY